jgi:hypothetical protein
MESANSQSTAPAPKLFRERWKDIVELHVADAGGRDHMSEAMLSLCRRAATLEIQLEQLECCMSQGDDVDIEGVMRKLLILMLVLSRLVRKCPELFQVDAELKLCLSLS